jgi:hypothetical protein
MLIAQNSESPESLARQGFCQILTIPLRLVGSLRRSCNSMNAAKIMGEEAAA